MKRALYFLLIICLIFALSGCKKDEEPGSVSGFEDFDPGLTQGGVVEAYILRPDTLNPLTTGISINRRMLFLCFDSLFYIDSQFNTVPRLAKSQSVSDSGRRLTVSLRDDVTWHDGSRFSAEDVVYTVNNITGNENSYYRTVLSGLISRVRALDNYTVEFYLRYPNSGAASLLTFPILKKGTWKSESYTPVGTGPFMLKGDVGESAITLEKNPKWKCGHVYIDGVTLNILPDTDSVYSAFSAGVIDFVQITKENAGKFSISENIGYLPTYTENYTYLGLNCNDELLAVRDVRDAIAGAVDRTAFTKAVLSDYGIAATLPVHPKAFYYDAPKAPNPSPFIVKEEGRIYYRDPLEGTSVPLEFTILVNEENSGRCTAADYLAASLTENGIPTEVVKTDFETYVTKIAEGSFEMYLGGTKLSCDVNLHPLTGEGGGLNYGEFYSDTVESLLNKILRAENQADRNETLHKLQAELYAEVPHIPLYYENEMIVYNTKKIGNAHTVLSDNIYSFVSMCCVK